jgi:hypothetical protein
MKKIPRKLLTTFLWETSKTFLVNFSKKAKLIPIIQNRIEKDDYVLIAYDSDRCTLDNMAKDFSGVTFLTTNLIKELMNSNGRFLVKRDTKEKCHDLKAKLEAKEVYKLRKLIIPYFVYSHQLLAEVLIEWILDVSKLSSKKII